MSFYFIIVFHFNVFPVFPPSKAQFLGDASDDFAIIGGAGNSLKSKTTAKVKNKQSSIATVRDLLRTFAIFPAALLSRYTV
jgi:hypothetical protein